MAAKARRTGLRRDTEAFSSSENLGAIIGLLLTVVFFAAILGTVAYQLKLAAANTSVSANATAAALVPLILTFFVIAGVILPVGVVLVLLHERGSA